MRRLFTIITARLQFGETDMNTSTGAKKCTAVDGGNIYFSHFKKSIYQFKCTL